MPNFNYEGRLQDGKKIHGSYEANDINDVIKFLKNRSIIPIDIKNGKKNTHKIWDFLTASNIKQQEVLNFARQMATLIAAGVPIIKAVKELAKAAKNKKMQQELGGEPQNCMIYKILMYLFEEDDEIISQEFERCVKGELLCGEHKQTCVERVIKFIKEHREIKEKKIDEARKILNLD